MARQFKQGRYIPKNPAKYIGKRLANGHADIVYRSSWEKRLMIFADNNPNVIQWNSEDVIIPYFLPSDGKMHRYFVDFIMTIRTKDGTEKTYLVEVKPLVETMPPVPPKRKTKKSLDSFLTRMMTWEKNQAKWDAARKFCKQKGIDFLILTERDIFPSGKA